MRRPLILALAVGAVSVGIAGATLAQAAGTAPAPGHVPALLNRPRTPADAVAPEMANTAARKGGPVVAEARLLHRDGNRTFWLAPSNSGGVCVLVMVRGGAGGASVAGANCVTLDDLAAGPVYRLHSVAGDVDVAVAADGAATDVAGRRGGRAVADNLVYVPWAPTEE